MKAKWLMAVVAVGFGAPLGVLAAGQARTVEIAVTTNGFEPARVKVTKDVPLKLVVTRKTDETCAKEIVIPDENIKADLPLNKPVTLSFTPKRTGEIKYACGMNMITGVLEVASSGVTDRNTSGDGRMEKRGGMMGQGMMGGGTMSCCGGMMGGTMEEMSAIHRLLSNHEKIHRTVKDIPDGVETTTSSDPKLTAAIREHVGQMKHRIETGEAIRQGDPLFREIFANHQHVHMSLEEVPGGVRVKETADEPRVVPLVRQHARRAVSEFVSEGMSRAMQPTPLPPGYEPSTEQSTNKSHSARSPRSCGCAKST